MDSKDHSAESQEMEYATKPPSNISDIVCKFAKACRFRSIGVFSTENPTHNHQPIIDFGNNVPSSEDSSDATEEAECDIEKIHPNPVEIQPKTTECVNMEILKLCCRLWYPSSLSFMQSLCSGNDSSILAVTEGCQLSIWDLRMKENGGCVHRIYGSVGDIFYAVCSSSTSIAVGGADCTVTVYDPHRYLDHNQFTGRIPDAFYKHTFLKEMYIEGNAFRPGVNPIGVHNVLEVSDTEFLF